MPISLLEFFIFMGADLLRGESLNMARGQLRGWLSKWPFIIFKGLISKSDNEGGEGGLSKIPKNLTTLFIDDPKDRWNLLRIHVIKFSFSGNVNVTSPGKWIYPLSCTYCIEYKNLFGHKRKNTKTGLTYFKTEKVSNFF